MSKTNLIAAVKAFVITLALFLGLGVVFLVFAIATGFFGIEAVLGMVLFFMVFYCVFQEIGAKPE